MRSRFDVIIAGGGVIGCACAWFLARNPAFDGSIAVVEPDPGYRHAASALSAGSIRQQFSTPINISISRFGMEFLRKAGEALAVGNEQPDIMLSESTYLYLVTAAGYDALRAHVALQKNHRVPVEIRGIDQLKFRFPWMNFDGIAAGSLTSAGEGWFDGFQLLMAFRKSALSQGVSFIESRVAGVSLSTGGPVDGVTLANGQQLDCGWLVNAAGTRARDLCAGLNIDLPVYPRKRCAFVFECERTVPDCPLVVDPSGLWFRPEGNYFICGMPPVPDPDVDPDDFSVDHVLYEERLWPLLAGRVPDFNAIRLRNSWAGHYDYNAFDQNAIVGPHPEIGNFLLANGFSGHGLQQAPAIGRGISEWIVFGAYRSLDLEPLSWQRLDRNEPLIESNVI